MHAWLAPLLGTSIGLLLSVAGALLLVPDPPIVDIRPAVQWVMQLSAPAPRPAAAADPAPVAVVAPQAAALPPPVAFARRPPMPAMVPTPPAEHGLPGQSDAPEAGQGLGGMLLRPPPDWATGTGFFVNSHGSILTAAHVVEGCRGVRVLSQFIRPDDARVVARDVQNDIAMLDVDGVEAPAWLPVSLPARDTRRLLVLGFPRGSLPDVPNETWARLANGAFPASAPVPTDLGAMVWLRNADIAPGYSGGPIVDPGTGRVVGLVRAVMDPSRAPSLYGVATHDLALGPGSSALAAMLSRWTVREGVIPAGLSGAGALEMARKATVRVVCTR